MKTILWITILIALGSSVYAENDIYGADNSYKGYVEKMDLFMARTIPTKGMSKRMDLSMVQITLTKDMLKKMGQFMVQIIRTKVR